MSGIKDAKKKRARRRRKRQIQRILLIIAMILILIGFLFLIRAAVHAVVNKFTGPTVTTSADKTAASQKSKKTTAKKSSKKKKSSEKKSSEKDTVELKTVTLSKKGKNNTDKVSLTISSTGDCTLGTDESFNYSTSLNAYYESHGADYFFQHVRSIFKKDDLSIVNMEGTLTDETAREAKTFAFKAPAEYASILSGSSIEAANLANNHSHDYGDQSYEDTIQYLEAAGITTFGYDRTAVMDVKGIKVGLIGIYELKDGIGRQQQVIDTIQEVKNQGAQVIIVSFHWGTEKSNIPDDAQKTLAHLAIDQGADLVVGHHPHVLQGIEKYQGKNIVYSLGNFCFGGNKNPSDKDTMIFQQTFTVENGKLAEDDVTNIIPCSLSSESGYNNYQPMVLEGSEKERVLQKIEDFSTAINQ